MAILLYNGTENKPEETILRLSDSFPEAMRGESDAAIRVRMLNINNGKNKAILDACKPLSEYSWLIQRIRDNAKTIRKAKKAEEEKAGLKLDDRAIKERNRAATQEAVGLAIKEMPEDYVIKPFLMAHYAEVKGMLLTEYNEAEAMELFRKDGEREGQRKILTLMQKLFALGRVDDAKKASSDEAYRLLFTPPAGYPVPSIEGKQ